VLASIILWRSSAAKIPICAQERLLDARPFRRRLRQRHHNKIIATIAGNIFGKDVQAYPKYGSEKKGLPTTYYLTIGDSHIYMHSELEHIDLLCINDPTAS